MRKELHTKRPQTKNEAFAQLDTMLSDENKSAIIKALRTEMLFFEADNLSEKIIEYYQRYLKRKGL